METKADDLSCFEVNDVARCLRVSRAQLYELIKNDRRLKPNQAGRAIDLDETDHRRVP